ncbi:MAG: hypothetical protein MZU97_06540 [Bacillus subtilis]|nr:hypothetical protein [Bacillus subtilis]
MDDRRSLEEQGRASRHRGVVVREIQIQRRRQIRREGRRRDAQRIRRPRGVPRNDFRLSRRLRSDRQSDVQEAPSGDRQSEEAQTAGSQTSRSSRSRASAHTTSSYLEAAKTQVKEAIDWKILEETIEYVQMDFASSASYEALAAKMELTRKPLRIFYLAVAPELLPVVARGVSEAQLDSKKRSDRTHRLRKAVRGRFIERAGDQRAAVAILRRIADLPRRSLSGQGNGSEHLLVMRFANRLFENNWNHLAIEKVTILAKETEGVMNRGNYYDDVGALKTWFKAI